MKFLSFLLLLSCLANAQIKRCAVAHCDSVHKIQNPNFQIERQHFETDIQKYIKSRRNARAAETIIKIPVVVHIIHSTASGAIGGANNVNISDEQVLSQIKVLNDDFAKSSKTDTLGADKDSGIRFFLATHDPNGEKVKTNTTNEAIGAIIRTYNSKTSYDIDNELSQLSDLSYWDSNRYLNIWVTNIKDDYLGYANFPSSPTQKGLEDPVAVRLDGVFIHYKAFGTIGTARNPYNLGRTTTHEVGHWLGLLHTWGDAFCGDDYVNDTPATENSNLTFSCTAKFSKCNGQTKTRNLIENYMDYSPDACMTMFTKEQKERMRAVLQIPSSTRNNILKYANLPLSEMLALQVNVFPNPAIIDSEVSLVILLPKEQDVSIYIQDFSGSLIYSKTIEKTPSVRVPILLSNDANSKKNLTLNQFNTTDGMYVFTVVSETETVSKKVWIGY